MTILAIETSSTFLSVALVSEDGLLASYNAETPRTHAEKLVGAVDRIISQSGIKRKDIRAIAVSSGPGSYTGLRIGMSSAKGYAMALGIPIIAVSTFAAMARRRTLDNVPQHTVCLISARKEEWYFAEWESSSTSPIPTTTTVDTIDNLLTAIESNPEPPMIVTSEKDLLLTQCPRLADGYRVIEARADAGGVGSVGIDMLKIGLVSDIHDVEPDYLRSFQAIKGRDVFEKLEGKLGKPKA